MLPRSASLSTSFPASHTDSGHCSHRAKHLGSCWLCLPPWLPFVWTDVFPKRKPVTWSERQHMVLVVHRRLRGPRGGPQLRNVRGGTGHQSRALSPEDHPRSFVSLPLAPGLCWVGAGLRACFPAAVGLLTSLHSPSMEACAHRDPEPSPQCLPTGTGGTGGELDALAAERWRGLWKLCRAVMCFCPKDPPLPAFRDRQQVAGCTQRPRVLLPARRALLLNRTATCSAAAQVWGWSTCIPARLWEDRHPPPVHLSL